MGNFNLDNYEPVADRLRRWLDANPDGRVVTRLERVEGKTVIFSATLYVHAEDQARNLPRAVGWAHEEQGQGMVNRDSHYENAETSAIGRALANCGYHGTLRPSREEMEGAQARAASHGKQDALARDIARAKGSIAKSLGVLGYDADAMREWVGSRRPEDDNDLEAWEKLAVGAAELAEMKTERG